MSGPAILSLKKTLGCRIGLLTSSMGAPIGPFVPGIDETMVADLPWIKTTRTGDSTEAVTALIKKLREKNFDAAIVFSVYSQSALPAAVCLYQAGVPLRLAYCRENPYELLTDWVPDQEPYENIRHQVQRDLHLIKSIGVEPITEQLQLIHTEKGFTAFHKTAEWNIGEKTDFLILHPGVSDKKREYPSALWIQALAAIRSKTNLPVIFTGSEKDKLSIRSILSEQPAQCFDGAGKFNMAEWISLISRARAVVTVNTATSHIAAAVKTPAVVLYALTNPQHTPWNAKSEVLPFSVPENLQSRNQVIGFVNRKYFNTPVPYPGPEEIVRALQRVMCRLEPDLP